MIILHHLGRPHNAFAVNRDLILAVEANPDTVITLTTGDRMLVRETPQEVVDLVREARTEVLARALGRRGEGDVRNLDRPRRRPETPLKVIGPTDRPGDKPSA